MTTAYQHRPMSSILAPATDPKPEGQKDELPPRDAEGKFTSPEQKAPEGLPEKYQGKTPEEIAEMHRNAEKELGRLRNEIGNYRGLVNDLTTLQRKAPEPQSVEPEKIDVSGDELLTDPGSAIDKVVSQRLAEREAKEAELAAQERVELEGRALLQSFPDLDTIVTSTEFQEFASRTPSRQQDFLTAAQGEGIEQVRAARRLMEDFDDFQNASAAPSGPAKQDPQPGVAAAKAVSNEGGGPAGAVSTKPLIHETDVLKLIASDPAKYRSPSFQKELMDAMREGRYVKQ